MHAAKVGVSCLFFKKRKTVLACLLGAEPFKFGLCMRYVICLSEK